MATTKTRRLTLWDKCAISTVGATHLLALYAPFYFSWSLFFMAYGLGFITGCLGICLSYHRNLSHKSFKIPKWLEYFFAYCGVHALQGDPISWVSNHRFHHQHTDTERDPHSPILGFWHGHMTWIFDYDSVKRRCGKRNNVEDLRSQAFYRWIHNTYPLHPLGLTILLYALGGFPYIVYGMGLRVVCGHHATWLVNSAAHIWGTRSWNTNDLSRNNWWVSVATFGEGWHNNHHAFQYSARQGLEWWQFDIPWYIVKTLEAIGLAYDVKLPSHSQMQKLAIKSMSIQCTGSSLALNNEIHKLMGAIKDKLK